MKVSVDVRGREGKRATGGQSAGSIFAYELTDLVLDSNRSVASHPDTVVLTTYGGMPGGAVLWAIVGINSTPTFRKFWFGFFDASGRNVIGGTVPAGITGLELDIQSVGFYLPGIFGFSNVISLTIP